MSVVFISYRRDDSSGQARALSKSLEEVVGKDSVFIDVDSIEVGVDVRRVLEARLKAADIMFALIGPRWLEDEDGAGHRRLDDPKDLYVRRSPLRSPATTSRSCRCSWAVPSPARGCAPRLRTPSCGWRLEPRLKAS